MFLSKLRLHLKQAKQDGMLNCHHRGNIKGNLLRIAQKIKESN